jgi:hypothetical protein
MGEKTDIQGGPADGLPTAPGRQFAWLDVVVLKRSERTATAGLYELVDGVYHYIGGHRSICECGAIFVRAEGGAERQPCPLCGHANEGATA